MICPPNLSVEMDGDLDSSFARLRMQLVHLGQVVVGVEGVLFALKLVPG